MRCRYVVLDAEVVGSFGAVIERLAFQLFVISGTVRMDYLYTGLPCDVRYIHCIFN